VLSISSASAVIRSWRRAAHTTAYPSPARARAVAAPIPLLAPVTTAVRRAAALVTVPILQRTVTAGPTGWHTGGPMGRHVDAAGTPRDLRRAAQVAGLLGGIAWVLAYFLPDGGSAADLLLPAGAVLLTLAMFGLGLLLVRSDFLALRVFVGIALPTLVWGVFGVVHQGASDPSLVDAVFGGACGLLAGLRLAHRGAAPRATL
jgi:hypothetical protein